MAKELAKKKPEQLKLADFLCFSIYTTSLAFTRAYRPLLKQNKITYTQWIALVALAEEDGIGVGDLGAKLYLESNTLTPMLKKLENRGFLTRERSRSDERQVTVRLTSAGREIWKKRIDRDVALCTGLPAKEISALQRSVAVLRENLIRNVST